MPAATFFNTNNLSIQVNVNNGPAFNVSGVSYSWAPQSPQSGGPSLGYNAGPNQFGPGANNVRITFPGGTKPLVIAMNLPDIQWISMQVYVFFNNEAVRWIALNNGVYVAGG